MSIFIPAPGAPDPDFDGLPDRFRPQHKSIQEISRNYGIEVVAEGPGICELCEKPGSYPYAGFFSTADGTRLRLCELCLLDMSVELGFLLAASAFLRQVGGMRSPQSRCDVAGEIASFAHLFDVLLTRRFGPAQPSCLLEHFARLGRSELSSTFSTH